MFEKPTCEFVKDIANFAGVSVSTASVILIINQASTARRGRVLRWRSGCTTVPTIQRSLITKKSSIIGLVVTDIRNPFRWLVDVFNHEAEKTDIPDARTVIKVSLKEVH